MRPELDGLDTVLRAWAEALLDAAASPVTITSVRRSRTRQARLYRARQAGQHPYPVAPPGQSKHELGLAWDMIGDAGELRRLGRLWESWGGLWGGEADRIHFEATTALLAAEPSGRT